MKQALAIVVLLAAPAAAQFRMQAVYGSDTRQDLYQVDDVRLLGLADSTVDIFQSKDVSIRGEVAKLATVNYGIALRLCREERFYTQNEGGFCSGSLVAPDIILTAGHCAPTPAACAALKFVFGFSIKERGNAAPASVPASEVYGCKALIGARQSDAGPDWALVRLDRKVEGHLPLRMNLTDSIEKNAEVLVIGHPEGLPTKIADGARVRGNSNKNFFVANLDTYGGNSGSPVFNSATGLIEGILVRGEDDYVKKGACRVSKVCPADGCRGEDVIKIGTIADNIPPADLESRVAGLQPKIEDMLARLK